MPRRICWQGQKALAPICGAAAAISSERGSVGGLRGVAPGKKGRGKHAWPTLKTWPSLLSFDFCVDSDNKVLMRPQPIVAACSSSGASAGPQHAQRLHLWLTQRFIRSIHKLNRRTKLWDGGGAQACAAGSPPQHCLRRGCAAPCQASASRDRAARRLAAQSSSGLAAEVAAGSSVRSSALYAAV